MIRVTGLFLYPVKACRGVAVTEARVDAYGFAGDRRFLIVDATGRFVTQRQHPRLALVATQLDGAALTLAADGRGAVRVPLDANHGPRTVSVWKDTMTADDCGDEPAAWLSEHLGFAARLVHVGSTYRRPVKPAKARPGDEVSFADAYPFLLISEASLDTLNDRLVAKGEEPVPMDRFRPNIVVAGCAPFAEDRWTGFRIGPVAVRAAGPCARCVVTTTDQQTGARGPEPLRTLAEFRRDAAEPTDVNFGQNLVHEDKQGVVRLGDEVSGAT